MLSFHLPTGKLLDSVGKKASNRQFNIVALLCSAIGGVHSDIKHNSMWSKVKTSFELFVLDVRIRLDYKTMILMSVKEVLLICHLHITDFVGIMHCPLFFFGLETGGTISRTTKKDDSSII